MQKKLVLSAVIISLSTTGLFAKDAKAENAQMYIAFVDSFEAMRKCSDGEKVSKEIDTLREKASKEIRSDAEKLAKAEMDLKNKATMLKPQELAKQERELAKSKRALEELLREKEDEIKITMQQKTEELAMKIEEGIVAVAKEKNVDAVIDKMTGRVMYTKDNNKGDITADAIKFVDKKSDLVAQAKKQEKTIVAKGEDKGKADAA